MTSTEQADYVRQEIEALDYLISEQKKGHAAWLRTAEEVRSRLQAKCPHIRTSRHGIGSPSPSDKWTECDDCGAEVGR